MFTNNPPSLNFQTTQFLAPLLLFFICINSMKNCNQMVGRTDFGRTPLYKDQYRSLMVKNLRFAIMEQYAKTSIILVFLVHLFVVEWSILHMHLRFWILSHFVGLNRPVLRMCCKSQCGQPFGHKLLLRLFRLRFSCINFSNSFYLVIIDLRFLPLFCGFFIYIP